MNTSSSLQLESSPLSCRYPDCDLRASASLALAKFMLVSSEFCEKNLQVFNTEYAAMYSIGVADISSGPYRWTII